MNVCWSRLSHTFGAGLPSSDQTYMSKFNEAEVQVIIAQNRSLFEPDADAIIIITG